MQNVLKILIKYHNKYNGKIPLSKVKQALSGKIFRDNRRLRKCEIKNILRGLEKQGVIVIKRNFIYLVFSSQTIKVFQKFRGDGT